MFVYIITNKINNKQYVGQHVGDDLQKYLERNFRLARLGHRGKCLLYRAFRKYEFSDFLIKPLVIVGSKLEMNLYEKGLIKSFNTKAPFGYNLTDGGDGCLGLSKRILIKRGKKISKSLLGNQNCLGRFESLETRRKKSIAHMGNKYALGVVRSPEYCRQKSESQIGHKCSEETKKKMSESAKKRKDTDETRKKKSDNAKRLGLRPPQLSHEQLAQAGRISCHRRCHFNKGIVNPQCALCREATNGTTAPEHSRSLENATQC